MAEFCPECWRRYNGYSLGDGEEYVLSDDLDLCEGCGEWKRVIVTTRRKTLPKMILDMLLTKVKIGIMDYRMGQMERERTGKGAREGGNDRRAWKLGR